MSSSEFHHKIQNVLNLSKISEFESGQLYY